MFLHEIIRSSARNNPDGPALISDGSRVSFAELWGRIAAMAGSIENLTQVGGRVVVISENSPAMLTALYALPLVGTVATLANTRHTPAEIAELITATAPSLVLGSDSQLSKLQAAPEFAAVTVEAGITVADLELLFGPGPGTGRDIPDEYQGRLGSDGDCAWLIHTSGTTGRPKGAMLTHRSLLAAVENTAAGRRLADDDIYLFPFPLFHVAAYNVLHCHYRGRPVVLIPGFDAARVLDLIESERVTSCSLAPTMLAMLLDHPHRADTDLSSLRQVSYGAASMPLDLLLRVGDELPGCGLAQGYGMTELSGNAAFLTPEDHLRARSGDTHLLAAAGRPGPLAEFRIIDDDDRDVAPGGTGEILVRGDQVCVGYFNSPTETADCFLDDWFRTGDIGRIDDQGFLYVVDRKKDLVITGGENVSSREVEDLLSTHPDVAHVAVVGLPDSRWGETVAAVVVPTGPVCDPQEVIAWTKGRISGFKRPRRVFLVDKLPLNASGKVDKVAIRAGLQAQDT